MKLENIKITVIYEDEDGDTQIIKRQAYDFEEAEERLMGLKKLLESKNV